MKNDGFIGFLWNEILVPAVTSGIRSGCKGVIAYFNSEAKKLQAELEDEEDNVG